MNKTKLIFTGVIAAATLLALMMSCVKKEGKLPVAQPTIVIGTCDTITYAKQIKPIIDANCVSCHSDDVQNGGVKLNTYALVKDRADAGRIQARVIDAPDASRMPQPPNPALTQAQKDLLTCWLNNGKKE